MRAVITGASGAAAFYLARHLAGKGETVAPMARPDCDMRNLDAVAAVLERERPEVIYHLASNADVRASFYDRGAIFRNNVECTLNLFEACLKLEMRPVIVNCSTSEVYGQSQEKITEDFPIAPLNPYAVAKTTQDMLGRMYAAAYAFPVVTIRPFGYVNPMREGIVLSRFARQIAEIEAGQREVLEHGYLESVRTFCDIRDIVRAMELAAETGGGIFNIGSEYPISVRECLAELVKLARVPIRTKFSAGLARPTDVSRVVPDCTRFRRITGWEPEILLPDSLRWLLDHYRAQVSEPKLRAVS